MTDAEDPKPPLNRAQRRAAGKPGVPQAAAVNSRAGQMRAERAASARATALSKPQMKK